MPPILHLAVGEPCECTEIPPATAAMDFLVVPTAKAWPATAPGGQPPPAERLMSRAMSMPWTWLVPS